MFSRVIERDQWNEMEGFFQQYFYEVREIENKNILLF